jgi:hypothetical protein
VQASCLEFETRLDIESSEPPERIQQLVGTVAPCNAERPGAIGTPK